MASVLDRVNKLLALAASSNMHEARNAAVLAARLIRDHGLVVREPEERPAAPRRPTPKPARVKTPVPKRKTPGSKRGVHAVRDAPSPIVSPLGGECVVCGKRYRAGDEVLWSDAEGGIHPACLGSWGRRRRER
jgi:hypothetical protein